MKKKNLKEKLFSLQHYLETYLPGECLLDAVKAALRVVFTHIWQIEVKGMRFIGGIIFRNFDKLKVGKKRNISNYIFDKQWSDDWLNCFSSDTHFIGNPSWAFQLPNHWRNQACMPKNQITHFHVLPLCVNNHFWSIV